MQIFELAKIVAESIHLPFKYDWYGDPDRRSYRVSFDKIKAKLDYKANFTSRDGAKEVFDALKAGVLKVDDPRTITVKWYKNLLESYSLVKSVEMNGAIL